MGPWAGVEKEREGEGKAHVLCYPLFCKVMPNIIFMSTSRNWVVVSFSWATGLTVLSQFILLVSRGSVALSISVTNSAATGRSISGTKWLQSWSITAV